MEGRGMGRGTLGREDGHYRDFQEGKQGILRRWVWGGLTGVEKIEVMDGGGGEPMMTRGGGEQLF